MKQKYLAIHKLDCLCYNEVQLQVLFQDGIYVFIATGATD